MISPKPVNSFAREKKPHSKLYLQSARRWKAKPFQVLNKRKSRSESSKHQLSSSGFHAQRLSLTLAPLRQPRAQSFRKTFRGQAEAGFHATVLHRQSVVELRRVGKIAHAELIQPLQRAVSALTFDPYIHVKFLCVHVQRIAPRSSYPRRHCLASRPSRTVNWSNAKRSRIPPGFVVPGSGRMELLI